ncbi:MAG: heavy metal-binding domain-containing protein [Euryarchaeota archaeon]|nr:heavy metal-binding domain-containing protein [Euryarchaeota archaeon]
MEVSEFIVASCNHVPGYEVLENRGFVYGLTVRSRGLGGQIGAGIRSVFGGEIKEYVKMMEQTRDEALNRMVDHAKQMDANAIISVRFDSNDISDIMQEILAYGTAVIVQKK